MNRDALSGLHWQSRRDASQDGPGALVAAVLAADQADLKGAASYRNQIMRPQFGGGDRFSVYQSAVKTAEVLEVPSLPLGVEPAVIAADAGVRNSNIGIGMAADHDLGPCQLKHFEIRELEKAQTDSRRTRQT